MTSAVGSGVRPDTIARMETPARIRTTASSAWSPAALGALLALVLGWSITSANGYGGGATATARPASDAAFEQTVADYPRVEREVRFTSGEVTLAGSLTLPRGPGPFPAVVALSGAGAQDRDGLASSAEEARVMPAFFAQAGIALLRTDDRGVGGSTGDSVEATFDDLVADARAAMAFLAERPDIDSNRIGLLGASQGAAIAARTAAEHGAAFVVLYSGPGLLGSTLLLDQIARLDRASGLPEATVERIVERTREAIGWIEADVDDTTREARLRPIVEELRRLRRRTPFSTDHHALTIEREIDMLTSPAYRAGLAHDPAPFLRRLRCPVLVVYGELDLQVHPDVNLPPVRAALDAAPTDDVTVVRLPGLNHLLQPAITGLPDEYASGRRAPAVHQRTTRWIGSRFGEPGGP